MTVRMFFYLRKLLSGAAFAVLCIMGTQAIGEDGAAQQTTSKMLIMRPIDASTSKLDEHLWCTALLNAQLHFRLGAVTTMTLIPAEQIAATIPDYSNLSSSLGENDYDNILLDAAPTHRIIVRYEIPEGGKSMLLSLECVSQKDGKTLAEIEKGCLVEHIGPVLDSCILSAVNACGITPTPDLRRFLSLPVLPTIAKDLRQLGSIIAAEQFGSQMKQAEAAVEYKKIFEKNSYLLLAAFLGQQAFLRAGLFTEAIALQKTIQNILPDYLPLYGDMAQANRSTNHLSEAYSACETGLRLAPETYRLLLEKGMVLEVMKRFDEAMIVFKTVVAQNKNEPRATLFYARYYNEAGKATEALACAEKLISRSDKDGEAWYEKGRSLLLVGKLDQAIPALINASNLMPFTSSLELVLGNTYVEQKDFTRAFERYQKVLQMQGGNVETYLLAAKCQTSLKNPQSALDLLKKIEQKYPANDQIQMEMGLLFFTLHDTTNARNYLEKILKNEPRDPRVFVALGDMALARGDFDNAQIMYQKTLALTGDAHPIQIALARIAILKKNPMAAIELLKPVLAAKTAYPDANRYMADAWRLAGNLEKALLFYRKELQVQPDNAGVTKLLADLSYDQNDYATAKAEYARLITMDSTLANAFLRLALLSLREGNGPDAVKYLGKCGSLCKPAMEECLSLANGFFAAKNFKKSIEWYQQYLAFPAAKKEIRLQLADAHRAAKNDSAAAEAYLSLFTVAGATYTGQLVTAGDIFDSLKLPAKARNAYTLFLQSNQSDPHVTIAMIRIEYADKNYARVISLFKTLAAQETLNDQTLMTIGDAGYKIGDFAQAITALVKIPQSNAFYIKATELLALCYEKTRELDLAIEKYGEFLATPVTPRHADYAWHIGELYEKSNKPDRARAQYVRNTTLYPQDMRNTKRAAELFIADSLWNDACEVLQKAVVQPKAPAELLRMAVYASLKAGKTETAINFAQQYLAITPTDSALWGDLGSIYFGQRKYAAALSPLKKASGLMPGNSGIMLKLGIASFEAGQMAGAIEALKRANQLSSDKTIPLEYLARCYRNTKDTMNLLATLDIIARNDPKAFEVRLELGTLFNAIRRSQEAIAPLTAAEAIIGGNLRLQKQLALAYERIGNSDKRLEHLKKALLITDLDATIQFELGRYYSSRSDYAQAEPLLKRTIELDGSNAAAMALYADLLVARDNNKTAATELLARAYSIDTSNARYAAKYGLLLCQSDKVDQALKVLNNPLLSASNDPYVLYWSGWALMLAEENEKALPLLTRATLADPSCQECAEALGELYLRQANYKQAISVLMKAWSSGAYKSSTVFLLAKALLFDGKLEEAKDFFKVVLTKQPDNEEAIYRLSHVLIAQDRLSEAQQLVESAREKKGGFIHLALGEIYEQLEKFEASWIEYTVALKLLPDEAATNAGYGRLSLRREDYNEAIIRFSQAIAKDPDNLRHQVDLGRAYLGLKDYSTALDLFRDVAKRNPGFVDAFVLRIEALAQQNHHEKALEAAKEGVEANPKNAQLQYLAGREFLAAQQFNAAVAYYKRAASLSNDQHIEALKGLGDIYYQNLADVNKAKEYYKKYVKGGGKNAEVDRILQEGQ